MDSHRVISESRSLRRLLLEVANKNVSIQEFRIDPKLRSLWCEETIRESPPMRVEFEHAIVLGTIAEALSMRRGKNAWGKFLKIEPLHPHDVLPPLQNCLPAQSHEQDAATVGIQGHLS